MALDCLLDAPPDSWIREDAGEVLPSQLGSRLFARANVDWMTRVFLFHPHDHHAQNCSIVYTRASRQLLQNTHLRRRHMTEVLGELEQLREWTGRDGWLGEALRQAVNAPAGTTLQFIEGTLKQVGTLGWRDDVDAFFNAPRDDFLSEISPLRRMSPPLANGGISGAMGREFGRVTKSQVYALMESALLDFPKPRQELLMRRRVLKRTKFVELPAWVANCTVRRSNPPIGGRW